jgi:hypothetical protein
VLGDKVSGFVVGVTVGFVVGVTEGDAVAETTEVGSVRFCRGSENKNLRLCLYF